MKSLNRALDILEYVVCHEGTPITPTEAAEACGTNVASCVRTLRTLVERGYLEQVSRRDGYVPGPLTATLGDRKSGYAQIADASVAPLTQLSERIGKLVNVSVLCNGRRYVITHLLGHGGGRTNPTSYDCEDNLDSATGRLLMALMNKAELTATVRKCKIALEYWPGVENVDELYEKLTKLREQGWVKFWSERQKCWVIGSLIRVEGYPPAAIGFGVLNEDECDKAVKLSNEAAAKIAESLDPSRSFHF